MSEVEPNAQIVVETQRALGWGSQITYRHWVEGLEKAPLTAFQASHLAGVLRHVAELIRQRPRTPPTEMETAKVAMEISARAARMLRSEWENLVVADALEHGVHAAASTHGLKEPEVATLMRRHAVALS